jgi:23S rRNA (guanine1835-N2)-methyltransferase
MVNTLSNLKRYPVVKNDPLKAWNSADELILEALVDYNLKSMRILVVNDSFGAISCNLSEYDLNVYVDSFISSTAIISNSNNSIIPIINLKDLDGIYDLVLIQTPKNLSFFEDILCHLSNHLNRNSKIICTAMIKHLAKNSFDLLQKYIGVTSTSLAKKKARLIFANFEKDAVNSSYPKNIQIDGFEKKFENHSNVFSRDKLDIGTRFFLDNIPTGNYKTILDLGCANGIVGIKAKLNNPNSKIIFNDESMMAILSAKANFKKFFQDELASFFFSNCYENQAESSIDLVLCNPPFHQIHTIGDFIALSMFKNAKKVLKPGGELVVIGNSHLAYQVKLKKIFGNSNIITSNKKFMIIKSYKK